MDRKETSVYYRGYRLSLSDGSNWWITGNKDNESWINNLAAIMELDEHASNHSPKLIFSKIKGINDASDRVNYLLPPYLCPSGLNGGWISYDHKTICISCHNSIADVLCVIKNNEGHYTRYLNMWLSLQPIYQKSIRSGGLPFHAALVELEGKGVLLAAQGGTGKSTCYRRFPHYWKPLCDDETLVVLDKQKKYRAHAFPTWSDYLVKRAANTWNVQYSVPLFGVFFVEQSETNEVILVGEGHAAVLLTESAMQVCHKYWIMADREDKRTLRRKVFNNACKIANSIPSFILRVSPTGNFWEKIEKVL